jgi:hypothetical protein
VNKGEGALLGRYADVLCFARSSSFYSPRNAVYVRLCARSSAGESNGFLIQERVFARVFTGLRSVADARYFSLFGFAPRCTDSCSFARKISQAVESERESLACLCYVLSVFQRVTLQARHVEFAGIVRQPSALLAFSASLISLFLHRTVDTFACIRAPARRIRASASNLTS